MQKKPSNKKYSWVSLAGGTITLLLVLCWFLLSQLYPFLALNHSRDDASLLVVEGWIDNTNLLLATDQYYQQSYDSVIVSSTSAPITFIKAKQGKLRFDLTRPPYKNQEKVHNISLLAFADGDAEQYPSFELQINDSILFKGQSDSTLHAFTYDVSSFEGQIRKITVLINEDSSLAVKPGSLFIHSLLVDNRISIPAWARSVKFFKNGRKSDKNQVMSDQFSDAEIARKVMVHYGIPASKIVALSAPKHKLNRTFNSAETTARYIRAQYEELPAINIFTEGVHARRSYMLYSLAFNEKADIGVIAAPKDHYNRSNWWKNREGREYVFVQALKYIYAKFLFTPYEEVSSRDIIPYVRFSVSSQKVSHLLNLPV